MSVFVEVGNESPMLYKEARWMIPLHSVQYSEASSRSSGLTSKQIQEIVDSHNQLRAGEGASNMEALVCIVFVVFYTKRKMNSLNWSVRTTVNHSHS